ncbi:MAG: hypothetical protein OEZ06_00240 [Myxococcales bacterium]|nr:hypothetical protein [Myxococcales bacterium]
MRIALIGPAQDAVAELEQALEMLLQDEGFSQIIYLGQDGAAARTIEGWARDRVDPDRFLDRAAELACIGSGREIDDLLEQERAARRWAVVRQLPPSPARAIEMLDTWVVVAVFDKSVLDEDDIASAHIFVYGQAQQPDFKRFGPRAFFTPGPLSAGGLGVLDAMADGSLEVQLIDLEGKTLSRETLRARSANVVVAT